MSSVWNYFTLSGRVAYCKDKNCKYSKDHPHQAPTTTLIYHLKCNHPELYAQFKKPKKDEANKDSEQPTLKRAFASTSQICDEQPSIMHSLGLKGILLS